MLPSNSSLRQSRLACSELAMVVFVWQVEIKGSEDWAQELVFPESRGWVDTGGDQVEAGRHHACIQVCPLVGPAEPAKPLLALQGTLRIQEANKRTTRSGGDIPAPAAARSTVLNM